MSKKIKQIIFIMILTAFSVLSCWNPVAPPVDNPDPADETPEPELKTPDLTVSIQLPGSGVEPDSSFDITSTTTNNGAADSAAGSISYYLSENNTLETGSDVLIGNYPIVGIASGSSLIHSISYQWAVSGTYYIFAVVDPENTITENDETNNQSSGSIVINAGTKDMSIQSMDFSGDYIADGENLSISIFVENSGSQTITENFQIQYYLSLDSDLTPAGDIDLGTADVSTDIPGSGTENINSARLIPDSLNINQCVYIYALLDSSDEVTETDEGNNSITAGEAAIVLIYDNENSSRSFTLTFETYPPTGTIGTNPDTHLYLHDDTGDVGDPVWIDENDNGGTYLANNYSGLGAALAPGTYYVLVMGTASGPYSLSVRTAGIDLRLFGVENTTDPYETDDSHTLYIPDSPVSMKTGGFINRYCSGAADFDWFKIMLP